MISISGTGGGGACGKAAGTVPSIMTGDGPTTTPYRFSILMWILTGEGIIIPAAGMGTRGAISVYLLIISTEIGGAGTTATTGGARETGTYITIAPGPSVRCGI